MLKQALETLRGITEYASNEHAKAEARLLLKDLERVIEDHKDMVGDYQSKEAAEGAHAVFRMMGLEESEPDPKHSCRGCGADLSRESHASWCENAEAPSDEEMQQEQEYLRWATHMGYEPL